MHWLDYVGYFGGGLFFANSIPHQVSGVSGRAFQSPFAHPPGKGLSSSTVNVLWGMFNLLVAYLLIFRVGSFNVRNTLDALLVGAGMLVMSVMAARTFGKLHGGA